MDEQNAASSLPPKDEFLDACRFAKQVQTPTGPAILIGGEIYHVTGPRRAPQDDVVLWLVIALRSTPGIFGGLTQREGTISSTVGNG
jgi:hypothetical protein